MEEEDAAGLGGVDAGFADAEAAEEEFGGEGFGFGGFDEEPAVVAPMKQEVPKQEVPKQEAVVSTGTEPEPAAGGSVKRAECSLFVTFAKTHFNAQNTSAYQREPIDAPLLKSVSSDDAIAARSMHTTILKFMGDISETAEIPLPVNKGSLKKKLSRTLSKNFMKKKDDLIEEQESASACQPGSNPLGMLPGLEKAILLQQSVARAPALRDELYCQLMKQLSKNPSRSSHARGWILMALMAGMHVPGNSDLKEALLSFVSGFCPPGFRGYIQARLARTSASGNRKEGPSWLEFQAVKTRKYWTIPVFLADGEMYSLQCDSSTTAGEFVAEIAKQRHIKDSFGFTIYLNVNRKVYGLCKDDFVMDSVAQCEQMARSKGLRERDSAWTISFSREFFPPRFNPSSDPAGTKLCYVEISQKLQRGLLEVAMEDLMADLLAQQLYIEHSGVLNARTIEDFLASHLPAEQLVQKPKAVWMTDLEHRHATADFTKSSVTPQKVMDDFVAHAATEWANVYARIYSVTFVSDVNTNPNNNKKVLFFNSRDDEASAKETGELNIRTDKGTHHRLCVVRDSDGCWYFGLSGILFIY